MNISVLHNKLSCPLLNVAHALHISYVDCSYGADAKTEKLMITLAEYYTANKKPDSDWGIIPSANISDYLGSASYYERKIPEGFMEKKLKWAVCLR